jgi:hypothetical protein
MCPGKIVKNNKIYQPLLEYGTKIRTNWDEMKLNLNKTISNFSFFLLSR